MKKERKIIHVDMDCFYAAVEMRDNPSLRNIPIAVGGSPEQRGVLSTCNYEARKFGLHSAMPTSHALRLCPHLTLVPHHFEKYQEASEIIHKIFLRYTSWIEPLSLDEAFLYVTTSSHCGGSATLMAKEIKERIKKETGLTASAGVAPNKFLAKVASDYKKPDGLFVITPEQVASFMPTLEVQKIPGVGKKSTESLHRIGIKTCADIQKYGLDFLKKHFGNSALDLYELAHGRDDSEVIVEWKRKSLSTETTFPRDLRSPQEFLFKLPPLLLDFQEQLKAEMEENKQRPNKIVVKIKFDNFTQTTLEKKQNSQMLLDTVLDLFKAKKAYEELLCEAWERKRRPVRLIGIGVRFAPEEIEQLELFSH